LEKEGLTEEDQALLAAIEGESQTEPGPAQSPATSPAFSFYYWLFRLVGYDILLLFGDSGIGKTKICSQLAFELAKEGKTVRYYDTEGNLSQAAIDRFQEANIIHAPIADYKQMLKVGKTETEDVIILDSATLFITGKWARMDMHSRGSMLQTVQAVYYQVKQWCQQKGKIAIITAQPISVMGDRRGVEPMGDKANFMAKVIFYVKGERKPEGGFSNRRIVTYKSRDMPDQTLITNFETTVDGVKFLNMDKLKKMY